MDFLLLYIILFSTLGFWCWSSYVKRKKLTAIKEIRKERLEFLDPKSKLSPKLKGDIYRELFPLQSWKKAGEPQYGYKKNSKEEYGELIALGYEISDLDRQIKNKDGNFIWSVILIICAIVFVLIRIFRVFQ